MAKKKEFKMERLTEVGKAMNTFKVTDNKGNVTEGKGDPNIPPSSPDPLVVFLGIMLAIVILMMLIGFASH